MADANKATSAPTHVHGVPNPDRVGFVAGHLLETGVYDFQPSAAAVAERLGRPVTFVDDQGFHDEVVAGAVDPQCDRVAWLQCRSKEEPSRYVDVSFVLRATVERRPLVEWSPKTYNPYFGINPLAFEWDGDRLVFIYGEKHHVYCASFDAGGMLSLTRLVGDEFLPAEEVERRERQVRLARHAQWERERWASASRAAEGWLSEIPYERTIAAILAALFVGAIVVVYFVLPG